MLSLLEVGRYCMWNRCSIFATVELMGFRDILYEVIIFWQWGDFTWKPSTPIINLDTFILQFLRKKPNMRLPMAAPTHVIRAAAIVRNGRGWSASVWLVSCVAFAIDLTIVAKLLLDILPVLSNPWYTTCVTQSMILSLWYPTHDSQPPSRHFTGWFLPAAKKLYVLLYNTVAL